MSEVARNLVTVRRRIADAATAAGRDPQSVRLLAVSKRKPSEAIRAAYAEGQRDFGENYVQEMRQKAEELADLPDLRLHAIGHLQRNKVKYVTRIASAVHTVDSVSLAEALGRSAAQHPVPRERRIDPEGDDRRLVVLVEVNVSGEPQKSGCTPDDLPAVLEAIEAEPALRLAGLMTVPPLTPDPADARPYFDQLAALAERSGGTARLPELSMGMTRDLEVAIAAGATWVRIGTAIFGEREG
jgi:pyridoxal phosphate enzyme (YggS family)